MEVVRPPVGFLMPHQMIYHGTRRPTSPGGRRRSRIRTAPLPHEFYDGSWPTRGGVHEHVDDGFFFFRGVPASASAVAGLPKTTAAGGGERRGREEEEEEESACAVCLEGYAAGDALRTMPCAHAFHEGCIVEWLSVSSFCPLCRFKLPTQAEDDDAAQAQQAPHLI